MTTATEIAPDPVDDAPTQARDIGRTAEWAFVLVCCAVVLAGLHPELIVTDSQPLGTDLTGHAVVAWFDRTHLLGFLPGSWSDAAFNGFPVNALYPWLPTWIAGLLSFVLPLAVALKVAVAAPLVLLPFAAWKAARWADLPQPLPVMLAAGTLPFLYDTSCGSCGGTIQSTVNGEFAFAWAMLFGVLALGAVDRLARTGRGLVLTPLLVAATAFSHPLPSIWMVLGILIIAAGREVWSDRARLLRFLLAAGIAALISAMWWIPFVAYRDWMPANPLVRGETAVHWLFPGALPWEIALGILGLLGLVFAVRTRAWLVLATAFGALVAVAAFLRFTDGGPFYSIRVLPFWQYGRWALAAVGFAWLVSIVVSRVRSDRGAQTDPRIAPAVWVVATLVLVGSTWGWWGVTTPATTTKDGAGSILGVNVTVTAASTNVQTTLAGFAARSDHSELVAVQGLLTGVAQRYGCGTLMWDAGDVATSGATFGDPWVFWQAPIWTEGCIRSADNVLVDSSMTAPAMQMTRSLVSQYVEPLLPERPTFALDLAQGVERMRSLGIRYYLTRGGQTETDAAATKSLVLVAQGGPWKVWQVDKAVPVASLTNLPAVFEPRVGNGDWEGLSNVYFTAPTYTDVPLVQDGPDSWPRATLSALPEKKTVEAAGVTNIRTTPTSVTFDVARTGSPVIVRLSDFPGWSVTGADGPYRATSNAIVVVPTSTTVTLTKGRTGVDWLAAACGLVGLAALIGFGLYLRLQRHDVADLEDDETTGLDDEDDASPSDDDETATATARTEV